MKRVCVRLWALGMVLLMLPIGAAFGQATLPRENHYKVYNTTPIGKTWDLELVDQFGLLHVDTFVLEKWANPATKIHDGVAHDPIDPMIHQTWWRLLGPPPVPERTVIGIDQFGYAEVRVGQPVYLLNPALKNPPIPPPPPPIWNHYLCYEVIGSLPLTKPVVLIDQWGTANVVVVRLKLFCNPTEKRDLVTGRVDPILDYAAHLQCYSVDNPIPGEFHPLVAVDQFGTWQIETYNNDCLCVPALKEHVVSTEKTTWGQIKALYR